MTYRPYSDREIEIANILNSAASEGLSPEKIDAILEMVKESTPEPSMEKKKDDSELQIRLKLLEESDWRKRVALSALLISKSLE